MTKPPRCHQAPVAAVAATTTKPVVAARDFRCAHCHYLRWRVLVHIKTCIACSSDDDDDDDDASPAADRPVPAPSSMVATQHVAGLDSPSKHSDSFDADWSSDDVQGADLVRTCLP